MNCNGILLDLTIPTVMGILNLTPESFYQDSRIDSREKLAKRVDEMIEEGVDILDLGAMSSRPNATIIDEEAEWDRLEFAIDYILITYPTIPISIDTIHSKVAKKALDKGCHIINDISAGRLDKDMISLVSQYHVPYIAMHMQGTPATMVKQNQYPKGLMIEILSYFKERINTIDKYGIKDIVIDPGFGFAKNIQQNFTLLHLFHTLKVLDKPLLAGISRKSMIYKTLEQSADEALLGTTALHMVALQQGAQILRVHDVKEAKDVIRLFLKVENQGID